MAKTRTAYIGIICYIAPRNPGRGAEERGGRGSKEPVAVNPFASGVVYIQRKYQLRSVGSSTQLHLILRPDLESPRQARSIELLGTTRVGR
jgi:hypothetical protein